MSEPSKDNLGRARAIVVAGVWGGGEWMDEGESAACNINTVVYDVAHALDAAEQRGAERERGALRELIKGGYQPHEDGGDSFAEGWDSALDTVYAAIRARNQRDSGGVAT